jgi:hypothetical protein
MTDPMPTLANVDDYINQACAELAFAKVMGWHDWTWEEETDPGMVRGFLVQWQPEQIAGLIISGAIDDDVRCVLVTGRMPTYAVVGWITAGEAKQDRYRIGEG